jgi:hypothetical protein
MLREGHPIKDGGSAHGRRQMFLERIEIAGFRGINRLSLMLDDNTLLLG